MNFDSIPEFNKYPQSERPTWSLEMEADYVASREAIAKAISDFGDMGIVALFSVAEDCICVPDEVGN